MSDRDFVIGVVVGIVIGWVIAYVLITIARHDTAWEHYG